MERTSSPRVDDEGIEQQIRAKGLTAPRVTPADIEASIASEHYFTGAHGVYGAARYRVDFEDGSPTDRENLPPNDGGALHLLTFCVLVLKNGFTVTGESACASPENFDAEIGRNVARANAVQKIWPLLGFRLRDALHVVSAQKTTAS